MLCFAFFDKFRRLGAEEPEEGIGLFHLSQDVVRTREVAGSQFRSRRPEEGEEVGKRLCGVEVVVHRLVECAVDALVAPVEFESFCGSLRHHFVEGEHVLLRLGEEGVGDVDVAAVVGLQQGEFDHFGVIFFEQVGKQQTVAEGLAHLLSVDLDEPVVDPIFCKLLARERFRLRDLVLVVGEDEVPAAAVDVDLLAERLHVHRGALDMPARSAVAPGGVPEGFAGFCGLPEREIEGIALVFLIFDADALAGVFEVPARQFAVSGEGVHREVDVALRCRISVTGGDEFGDEILDALHGGGGFQPDVGVVHLEGAHLGVYLFDHHLGIFVRGDARLVRARDDLVVHVGVVAGIGDVIALFDEIFADDVIDERLIGVSDVRVAGHRDAAGVHLHLVAVDGLELFLPLGKGVVYLHLSSSPASSNSFMAAFSAAFSAAPSPSVTVILPPSVMPQDFSSSCSLRFMRRNSASMGSGNST